MKRCALVLALVLALPAGAEAKLTTNHLRAAAEEWASWMDDDTGETGYFVGRCNRKRAICRVKLLGTAFGDCTQTVYIRRKRRPATESEIVYRRKWVVGITDAGADCTA